MEMLPEEILFKIFMFCDTKSLENLLNTCVRFQRIITESFKLMMKLPLKIDLKNFREIKKIFKKFPYNNIQLDFYWSQVDSYQAMNGIHEELFEIVSYHSKHLLILDLVGINRSLAIKILKLCHKLKCLRINLARNPTSLNQSEIIEMPSLQILIILNDENLSQWIKAENLCILKSSTVLKGLKNFLKVSNNVKNLDVKNSVRDLCKANLKLHQLNCAFDISSSVEFLNSQKATLEELSISIRLKRDTEIIKCILYSLKLRKLNINLRGLFFDSNCFGCNNTIKELNITGLGNNEVFSKFISCFSAVTKLELHPNNLIDLLELHLIANALPNLKIISLKDCKFSVAEGTLLKNIELLIVCTSFNVKLDIDWPKIAKSCPNIKIIQLIDNEETLSMLQLCDVLTNCKNLQFIEIKMSKGFELTDKYIFLDLDKFTNLKSIFSTGNYAKVAIEELMKCCAGHSKLFCYPN